MLHGLTGGSGDVDGAIILDIDLRAALLLNLADHLSAWADDGADLFRVNFDGLDTRGVIRQFFAGGVDGVEHFFHDEHAAFARLL